MAYVDGFIIPVPRDKLPTYRKMARLGCKIWMEHGALGYHECVGDDVPYGKRTSFPRSVKARDDEVVIFSWIVYPSRRARDRINKAAMTDPRMKWDMAKMPFDPKRMIYGGFKEFVAS